MSEAVTVAAILAGTALILGSGILQASGPRWNSDDYSETVTGFRNTLGSARKVRSTGLKKRIGTPRRIVGTDASGNRVLKVAGGSHPKPVAHSWGIGQSVGTTL